MLLSPLEWEVTNVCLLPDRGGRRAHGAHPSSAPLLRRDRAAGPQREAGRRPEAVHGGGPPPPRPHPGNPRPPRSLPQGDQEDAGGGGHSHRPAGGSPKGAHPRAAASRLRESAGHRPRTVESSPEPRPPDVAPGGAVGVRGCGAPHVSRPDLLASTGGPKCREQLKCCLLYTSDAADDL